jgi:hypothetical protein
VTRGVLRARSARASSLSAIWRHSPSSHRRSPSPPLPPITVAALALGGRSLTQIDSGFSSSSHSAEAEGTRPRRRTSACRPPCASPPSDHTHSTHHRTLSTSMASSTTNGKKWLSFAGTAGRGHDEGLGERRGARVGPELLAEAVGRVRVRLREVSFLLFFFFLSFLMSAGLAPPRVLVAPAASRRTVHPPSQGCRVFTFSLLFHFFSSISLPTAHTNLLHQIPSPAFPAPTPCTRGCSHGSSTAPRRRSACTA